MCFVYLKYWRYACIDAPRYIALFIADNGGASEGIRFIAFRTQKRFLQGYGGSLAMSKEINPLVTSFLGARSSRRHQRRSVCLACAAKRFPNPLHWSGTLAITLRSLHFSTVQGERWGTYSLDVGWRQYSSYNVILRFGRCACAGDTSNKQGYQH